MSPYRDNQKQKVLVVDDQPINLKILGQALAGDYQVLVASNAEQALQIAILQQPDLILLDIIMQGMDGYQTCRALKQDSRTVNIPVIFSTSMDSEADEVKGLEAGAADYITKPYNLALVKARVRNQMQLKKKTDLLEKLVSLDGLTEIPNRRNFEQHFEVEWRRAQRSGLPLSLCMIDIDSFKQYNDNYGHGAGDICLQRVAQTLASTAKRSGDLVARYGGEEFVVLLPDTELEEASVVSERLRQAIESQAIEHKYSSCAQVVTISAGLASCQVQIGMERSQLMEEADKFLYEAKQQGRNRVSSGIYSPDVA
ncbi:diguanylate cyclase [Bowmanella denitrificans]|uniref:diguanylate cyclase n=1 Tax=Bowmanella denitrificans TaxID=366582 RepID=A0ABP3GDD6_9ALTE